MQASGAARGVLCVLIGLPAAGKSTLARALAEGEDVEWVRFDDDLEAAIVDTGFDEAAWRQSRDAAFQRVRLALGRARIVVADDNGFYRSMRHALFKVARDARFAFATAWVRVSPEEASRRNALRGADRVPADTIPKMAALFERPDASKHPWERHSLVVESRSSSTTSSATAAVLELADRAFRDGAPPRPLAEDGELARRREAARKETAENLAHAIDLALRRLVGDVLKDDRLSTHRAALAKTVNATRKKVQAARPASVDAALTAFQDSLLSSEACSSSGGVPSDLLVAVFADRAVVDASPSAS